MTPVSLFILTLTTPFAAYAEAPVKTQWGMVAEPSYPAKICATLPAALTSKDGSIDDYDADGKSTHPDRDRVQSAIEHCDGGAVKLVAGPKGEDAFLISPIILKSGVTLWIDKGVTLYASRDPADYDTGLDAGRARADCGTANSSGKKSCLPLIGGKNLTNAALVGEGKIDGRGGSRLLSGPNKGTASWWDLAWLTKSGLTQHVFRLVQFDGGENLTLYRLTFENSPNFHIVPNNFDGITAWGIKILSPSLAYTKPGYACPEGTTPDKTPSATCFTPDTVKNTDGFDPGGSSNVLLAYSWISTGDDNVAIKAGNGGFANGPRGMHNVTIAHNFFYYGHGMSLGSETDSGDDHFLITDLVMDGMDSPNGNGLRIKSDASRGGKVRDIAFEHICMRNEAHPLVFDTHYSDKTGTLYPDFQGISLTDFHYIGGGKHGGGVSTFRGFEEAGQKLPISISLEAVRFDGPVPVINGGKGKVAPFATHFRIYPGATSFGALMKPSEADDVTVEAVESRSSPALRDCTGVFLPLKPVLADSPI
ncbi:MAG: glycoside hydrolase family 28 protein [Asticcacaulis sp.]